MTPLRLVADARQSATYTTFTLNVLHDLGPVKAEEDIRRAMALGDVGGFQEMSDLEDRQTIMRVAQELNYGWYMPVNGGGGAIPIVWNRNRFLLIDGRSVMVHPGEENVTPARFINIVRLRELATGKVFGFINTHTLSGASFDAQATDMHLIPRLRLHLRMLHDEILALAGSTEHVFVGGDLNVNYLADRHRKVDGTADLGARRRHQLRHAAAGLARPDVAARLRHVAQARQRAGARRGPRSSATSTPTTTR